MKSLSLLIYCVVWFYLGPVSNASSLPLCPDKKPPTAWDKCFGELTVEDGANYTGEWIKGKFGGWGTFTSAKGAKLEGSLFIIC